MSILIWETLVPVLLQKSLLIFLLLLFVTPPETNANEPPHVRVGALFRGGWKFCEPLGAV